MRLRGASPYTAERQHAGVIDAPHLLDRLAEALQLLLAHRGLLHAQRQEAVHVRPAQLLHRRQGQPIRADARWHVVRREMAEEHEEDDTVGVGVGVGPLGELAVAKRHIHSQHHVERRVGERASPGNFSVPMLKGRDTDCEAPAPCASQLSAVGGRRLAAPKLRFAAAAHHDGRSYVTHPGNGFDGHEVLQHVEISHLNLAVAEGMLLDQLPKLGEGRVGL